MSLNPQEMANTRQELQANFELTGLSKQQIANDLHISELKLNRLFSLTQQSLNDPWILRNYLIERVQEAGKTPVPFTALKGDWHRHWFLDANLIDNALMSPGDN